MTEERKRGRRQLLREADRDCGDAEDAAGAAWDANLASQGSKGRLVNPTNLCDLDLNRETNQYPSCLALGCAWVLFLLVPFSTMLLEETKIHHPFQTARCSQVA